MGYYSAGNVLDELQGDKACESRGDAEGANDEDEYQAINLTLAQPVGKTCEDGDWDC